MGFLSSLMGSDSAKASAAAAADTYKKQQEATQGLTSYADTLPGQYQSLGQGYDPYVNAGGSALSMLSSGLGLNGQGGQEQFTQAYRGLPGYQSALDTGSKVVAQHANSGNMLQSGRALKALQTFGQNYEDQQSGNYMNRLMGLQGQGLQATGAQAGLGAQGLGQQAGLRQSAFGGQMNSAGTIGQGQVAGAQAKQQGLQNVLATGAQLVGTIAGGAMGGPMGAMLGSQLGSAFKGSGGSGAGQYGQSPMYNSNGIQLYGPGW